MSDVDVKVLPKGRWEVDKVHSSIGFAVEYLAGTFHGSFADFEANVDHGILTGSAKVGSVQVKDENLAAHLQGPDFFDAQVHPELSFASAGITRDGDVVSIDGALSIKGHTEPVEITGAISDPITDPRGGQRFGLTLKTEVDRDKFGISWNTPLPNGGEALSGEVTITAELQLSRVGAGEC